MQNDQRETIERLLAVDAGERDEAWEKGFLAVLPNARVDLLAPEARMGPDGWPYLMATTDGKGGESFGELIAWLSTRGIGLALNPHKAMPDFVLSYGMIWNFRERGEFLSAAAAPRPSGGLEISHGQEVLTGPPSESYLPRYARGIIKRFLLDQGVLAPRVRMVSFDRQNYDLCFSVESLNSPPANEHSGIAEALSWFLPADYSVCLISEKTVPGFEAL